VEQEDRGVWVVVHLYEPVCLFPHHVLANSSSDFAKSVDQRYSLNETIAHPARKHLATKFLCVRTLVLGFASVISSRLPVARSRSQPNSNIHPYIDEDDPYDDGSGGAVLAREGDDDEMEDYVDAVDTDVLPTMLVYRDGELVHNWVRVDWEAGQGEPRGIVIQVDLVIILKETHVS
jgi:hypothetical protein